MALINCVECGKEISDKAVSCPNCGYPISQESVIQKDKTELYSLKLISTSEKVKTIKIIRELFNVDLKEAKDIADSAPTVLASGLTKNQADNFAQLFYREQINVEVLSDSSNLFYLNANSLTPNSKYASEALSKNSLTYISCPTCGSTDFDMLRRNWSIFAGFMTNKVDRICRNCKCKY